MKTNTTYQFPIGKGKPLKEFPKKAFLLEWYQFPIGKGKLIDKVTNTLEEYQFPIGKGKNNIL